MKQNKPNILKHWFFVITIMLIFGLTTGETLFSKQKEVDPAYLAKIKEWQQKRLEGLKAKDSWLSLAGLFWLKEGKNTFGSDAANDLILTDVKAPARIGSFILENGKVRFLSAQGEIVMHGSKVIFEMALKNDTEGKPTILSSGTLSWFIIKRGDCLGVRVRDSAHLRIDKLKKIDSFPIDTDWRVEAVLERFEKPRMIKVPNVLGMENDSPAPGVLVFKINGKIHRLTPLGGAGNLFLIFGDETNTAETYGGGRFLSVKKTDDKGRTVIDFNMAVNPPCAFSPFATCPLPPKTNQLSIRVTAGEKIPHGVEGH
ncbi:DUF1684 domain-containing protein [Acidobacteriota bacterium]